MGQPGLHLGPENLFFFMKSSYEDTQKNIQWNAFLRKGMLVTSPASLAEVCLLLQKFLGPPTQALVQDNIDFLLRLVFDVGSYQPVRSLVCIPHRSPL